MQKADPLSEAIAAARALRELPPVETRRLLRKSAGVSLQAIADTIGVDRVTVYRWEIGTRKPFGRQAIAYADALRRLDQEAAAVVS